MADNRHGGVADTVRLLMRGLGQTLITLGVVLGLFCVYELQVTGVYTGRQQEALTDELSRVWEAPSPAPAGQPRSVPVAAATGEPLTVLHVPRFGPDYRKVVVEGVGLDDLKRGPGHYPGTALPGAVGNTVLSGHRTTYGAPFNRLDELRPGDAIVLETRDSWFTYRMTGYQIVAPTAVEVILPVPGRPGAVPRERLLTMTTCHPEYSAKQRLIVRAELEAPLKKAPGVVPPALAAGA